MKASELIQRYNNGERFFRGAYLRRADLRGANLRGANLFGADLRGANLSGANLSEAYLPAPPMVLLAQWRGVPRHVCRELMRYDAANHPRPELFEKWAREDNGFVDGPCPYEDTKIDRAANFTERANWYSPGPAKSAFELMKMVLRWKCRDSDYHTAADRKRWANKKGGE